jgi:hypothetical protein
LAPVSLTAGSASLNFKEIDVTTFSSYYLDMKFEWDENKRLVNLQKHKIDFIGSEEIFDGYTVTLEDDRIGYDEQGLYLLVKCKRETE